MPVFTNILTFVICCTIPLGLGQRPPEKFSHYQYRWTERLMIYRLTNMTAELLHDTTQKLKHASNIKDMYKPSITFELGKISAGIQERFRKMLKIYRRFANTKDFESRLYSIQQFLHAFHVIQGEYNEIRLEKSLFYEIKKRHESTNTPYDFKNSSFTPPPNNTTTNPKGRKLRRQWSPKTDTDFYNFPGLDTI